MQLRNRQTCRRSLHPIGHHIDSVPSIIRFALGLFVDSQPVRMGRERCDNLSDSITIEIHCMHLCTTRTGESYRMKCPSLVGRIRSITSWVLPPTILGEHVLVAIIIDIAETDPMRETLIRPRVAHCAENPSICRVCGYLGITEMSAIAAKKLRPTISSDILEHRRLVVGNF